MGIRGVGRGWCDIAIDGLAERSSAKERTGGERPVELVFRNNDLYLRPPVFPRTFILLLPFYPPVFVYANGAFELWKLLFHFRGSDRRACWSGVSRMRGVYATLILRTGWGMAQLRRGRCATDARQDLLVGKSCHVAFHGGKRRFRRMGVERDGS